jgi:NAD-reducing hydrogenase small subunit
VPREEVPALQLKVQPIHAFVKVDAWIPGCPPSAQAIWNALCSLLGLPPPAKAALSYD